MNKMIPKNLDRLVIHQIDIDEPSPGGIDTCIRGLLRHKPERISVGVVGVSVKSSSKNVQGKWRKVDFEGNEIWFLPVAALDPANQKRWIPHSIRLATGLVRYRHLMPKPNIIQAHRAEIAFLARLVFRKSNLLYSIHTQGGGISSKNSDSFWRFFAAAHIRMEKFLIRKAEWVLVFNPTYGSELQKRRPKVLSSATWFEPYSGQVSKRLPKTVLWAGRLEHPKNPILAIEAMVELARMDQSQVWKLRMAGVGTLWDEVINAKEMYASVRNLEIEILGRLHPNDMAEVISSSSQFLMTSLPGYEGYPRVLVEALAGGLPSVVTTGCDTGNLIIQGENGMVVNANPVEIARAVLDAESYSSDRVSMSVEHLSASKIISQIYSFTTN